MTLFEYANVLLNRTTKAHCNTLDRLQAKAIRIIHICKRNIELVEGYNYTIFSKD